MVTLVNASGSLRNAPILKRLGWPKTFHLDISPTGTGHDIWILGGASGMKGPSLASHCHPLNSSVAITWFSAAIIGMIVVDPLCHSSWWGRYSIQRLQIVRNVCLIHGNRRGAVFLAALFR